MYCKKCGKKIEDNSKFCDKCGAVIEDDMVKCEDTEKSNNIKSVSSVKKTINKPMLIAIIVVIAVLLLGGGGMMLYENYTQKKGDNAIQSIKDSYFTFLPDMTVGDLLYEYYGEDNWVYSVDNVVEFWGTNQKDESGLSLHFDSVKSDNTVKVTDRMYHEKDETAHNISEEEFEKYIINLYEQLDNSSKTTDDAKVTTKKVTTTKLTTTVITEEETNPELSANYAAYSVMLRTFDSGAEMESTNDLAYRQYYLYDINKDGTYELLIHVGTCEADAVIYIYSLDENGELLDLGEISGGHSWLSEKDGKLYTNFAHQGIQIVKSVSMVEDLGSWIIMQDDIFEKDGLSDYTTYGTALQGYDISDTSAIEALCPEEVVANKATVDGYVKTYDLSGRDGTKIRLYLSGNFAAVSVQIYNQEYTGDPELYSKDDFDDYIELSFNAYAQPESVVYVTPYNDSGLAGDVITCKIPTTSSGTIQTSAVINPVNNMKGQINCHSGTVAGFTTDYVVNGGSVGTVRSSLGDTWHVTAKNSCTNYGVIWYELWDSDDGDYYGWVDSNYIDFY